MLNKKTIQINPELFKISGGKSRKNREKKVLTLNSNVTPNNLKNKLLKRIKEHKTSGVVNNTNIKPKPVSNKQIKQNNSSNTNDTSSNYTDEFYGALNYLSDLSKQKKINEAKQRSLNTSTLKNHRPPSLDISLELPPELQETKTFVPQSNEVYNINYKVTDDVPYGCLKNGKKKTYREWKQLSAPDKIDIPDIIRPPTPPKKNTNTLTNTLTNTNTNTSLSREERLEHIKNKLKKIQNEETQIKQQSLDNFKKLEKEISKPLTIEELELDNFSKSTTESTEDIKDIINNRNDIIEKEKEKDKKYLKKTIKRKFTLGKSDKLRRVSVLIKDRQTRKNIINSQKELKKTAITDIKKYLRQHGMIKVGSTCPPDILRKTFESAILTGEVTNTNKDILLHNFLSSDKQD
jgi:hypothetical protein